MRPEQKIATLIKPTPNDGKKDILKILLQNQQMLMERYIELSQEVMKLRGEMREYIEQSIYKSFGDKIDMIEGSLRESILHKEIFIEKGFITREEINRKWDELKEKAGK